MRKRKLTGAERAWLNGWNGAPWPMATFHFPCPHCDREFQSGGALGRHVHAKHRDKLPAGVKHAGQAARHFAGAGGE